MHSFHCNSYFLKTGVQLNSRCIIFSLSPSFLSLFLSLSLSFPFSLSFFLSLSFFFSLSSLPYRYKEVCKFNFDNPEGNSGTNHFTQVVWKKSLTLGIGKAVSERCTYVVARYRPAGNVRDNYSLNVAKGSFNKGSCSG